MASFEKQKIPKLKRLQVSSLTVNQDYISIEQTHHTAMHSKYSIIIIGHLTHSPSKNIYNRKRNYNWIQLKVEINFMISIKMHFISISNSETVQRKLADWLNWFNWMHIHF